jgi:hypothetical protein
MEAFVMAEKEPASGETVYRSTAMVRVSKLSEKERESLLTIAKSRAPDPSVFEEEEPFFWTARSSNDKVDSYYTWMDVSSLENYARDATDPGVQFQVSHNGGGFFSAGEVGFGRSLSGEVKGNRSSKECLIDFYTIRGLSCGNVTSDAFIQGARSGIYSDVSIGFVPGEMLCNICGNDFLRKYDFEYGDEQRCDHWPGREYELERGKGTQKVTCILQVKDGRLSEVSLVYDGATPGAGIAAVDMARMAAAAGDLPPSDAQVLENIYHVRISPSAVPFAGVDLGEAMSRAEAARQAVATTTTTNETVANTDEARQEETAAVVTEQHTEESAIEFSEETETEEEAERNAANPMVRLREKYEEKGLRLKSDDPMKVIEALGDLVVEQRGRIQTLTKEAEYGRQAREQLLKELDESVVRAFGGPGAEERKERHRKMAEGLTMDEVRAVIDDLEERATTRIGSGGRTTKIDEAVGTGGEREVETPADTVERRGQTPAYLV